MTVNTGRMPFLRTVMMQPEEFYMQCLQTLIGQKNTSRVDVAYTKYIPRVQL